MNLAKLHEWMDAVLDVIREREEQKKLHRVHYYEIEYWMLIGVLRHLDIHTYYHWVKT